MIKSLVVEDDPDVLSTVSKMLGSAGHEVIAASTTTEAIAAVNDTPDLDMAIVDFWLAGQHVLPTLEEMLQVRPDLPVLVISGGRKGFSLEKTDAVSSLTGSREFLQKPFTRAQLLGKVDQLLSA